MMVHGSTFSGIGAAEIAAEMLGWKNAFHCEINPFPRQVLDYHYPDAESYEDITKTDFSKWRGKIDVLTGGFPCQPFSYAGKRRGSEDDRYLWPYMLRCIQQVRPTWFIGENVAGITTMVFPGEVSKVGSGGTIFDETDYMARDERFIIEEICQQLEDCGYSVQPMLIPACAVRAPHRRDRVFIVGKRLATDTSEPRAEGVRQEREDAIHRPQSVADTDGWRGFEVEESIRPKLADGYGLECTCGQRPTAYAKCAGLERQDESRSEESGERLYIRRDPAGCSGEDGIGGCCRWMWLEDGSWLPTQSPIHRGNDGLPFDVDRLTISFGKWRTEALKAYGNAIVPQVMYEIFRGIEQVTQKLNEKETQ